MSRIIIFTGKGGVGKTSMAVAHARKSSLEGKKTIIVSTDMAHNLGDIFGMRFDKTEKQIDENLYGLEIDPNYFLEKEYKNFVNAINNLLVSTGSLLNGEDVFDELSFFPGMDELVSLLKVLELAKTNEYERIIVDCAPTGETLSLLKFPELMCWYMEKFFPIGKLAIRVMSPFSKKLFQVQLPDRKAMNEIEELYLKFIELQELLKDKETTTIRLVTLPEMMVVEETKRNFMYMNLYNYQVDGLYINRILPDEVQNEFFSEWMNLQKHYIEELQNSIRELPITYIPWYDVELQGLEAIDRLVNEVLVEDDIFNIRTDRVGEKYKKTKNGYELSVYLPNVNKSDIELHEVKNELIIRIGNVKRNIGLPDSLRGFNVVSAKYENDTLHIQFE